jgi:predicted AAA+ superfamily ATPase
MKVHRLPQHFINIGKRLVKSPKVYLRDGSVRHALLELASVREPPGHPVVGASWEAFVVEQVAATLAHAHLSRPQVRPRWPRRRRKAFQVQRHPL